MTQEITVIDKPSSQEIIPHLPQKTIFQMQPKEMVAFATEVADVLKDVIDKQKLYTNISGRKYVRVEGWATLGTIIGILPVEDQVIEQPDGTFEATVRLIRQSDGGIVGRASAICGSDERTWGNRDRFARRSMAVTRATGKAYRLGLSWIMSLAGYEPTPAEEMPVPSEDKYVGNQEQKFIIRDALILAGIIEPEDMKRFVTGFHGVKMSTLAEAIQEYKLKSPL